MYTKSNDLIVGRSIVMFSIDGIFHCFSGWNHHNCRTILIFIQLLVRFDTSMLYAIEHDRNSCFLTFGVHDAFSMEFTVNRMKASESGPIPQLLDEKLSIYIKNVNEWKRVIKGCKRLQNVFI